MFIRLRAIYNRALDAYNAGSNKTRRQLAALKRYPCAAVSAYQAARAFLATPSHENLFQPLTPVLIEPGKIQRYERELLNGLKNDQVRNIAITGEYGAGKSSVLRTFVHRHPEFVYAFVSLATFGKDTEIAGAYELVTDTDLASESPRSSESPAKAGQESKSEENKAESDLVARIEETIVQQLLYSVPAKTLPKTRLKRIDQASSLNIWGKTLCCGLLILAALRLYVPVAEKLPKIEPAWLLEWLLWIPSPLAVGIAALGCILLLHTCLRLCSLFSIDGLTLKGGKLETTHHGSVLHKNIDEIIYCFERSSIDVVIIEDLDRFGIHDVFTRLREINFIIKQSPQVKRPVYFVYALRDEMFVVGEKTKFFDLIVPVIPVINSENSQEKMMELLNLRTFKSKPLGEHLDRRLVETVCYYIDDLRLVKNIVNEFDMFSNILASGLRLEPDKLFAIVAIRNLHPGAYADLVKRRGAIYGVIKGLDTWKIQQNSANAKRLDDLRRERDERVFELANNVAELRAYVWFTILRLTGTEIATHVQIGSTYYTAQQFVTEEVFDSLKNQAIQLSTVALNQHGQRFNRSASSVSMTEVLNATSYERRHALLGRRLGTIADEIAAVQRESDQVIRMSFATAVKKGYGEVVRSHLPGLDVVSYLMLHGFLDADYTDYLGYFYEGSLTPGDKDLILSLRRGVLPEVSTPVDSPCTVLEKLKSDELDEGRGIIVDLIACLSARPTSLAAGSADTQLSHILRSGLDEHTERMAIAVRELLSRIDAAEFIRAVYRLEPKLFNSLFNARDTGDADGVFEGSEARQSLVKAIVDNLPESDFKTLAGDASTDLVPTIDGLEDASRLMPGLESNVGAWAWLRAHPVQFASLGHTMSLADLERLIDWGCIKINLPMLSLICAKSEAGQDSKDAKSEPADVGIVSLRRLQALSINGLGNYLLSHADELGSALLDQSAVLDESSDSLASLLAELDADHDLTNRLFDHTTCDLHTLTDAPRHLWTKALESDRLVAKAGAVWIFFEKVIGPDGHVSDEEIGSEPTTVFTGFISRNASSLKGTLWQSTSADWSLQQYLLSSTSISNDVLKVLLDGVVLQDLSMIKAALPEGRWVMLVASSFLPYSSEVREIVLNTCPHLEGQYLVERWDLAKAEIDISSLQLDSMLTLSKSKALPLTQKIQMWSGLSLETIESKPEAVPELGRVSMLANEAGERFADPLMPVLRHLVRNASLTPEQRSEMLTQCLPGMKWPEVAAALGLLDDEDFKTVSAKVKKIKVRNTESNRRLVNEMRSEGYLATVTSEDDDIIATTRPSAMTSEDT
ncbi:YobI family P-loop NTPase [Pseudomonas aeruginosa]|uniref:YobI family P-loop NTPase n=1 Tax=Pseudomonas aeruginosa TaxID=287 RepID=UPI003F359DB7